MELDLGKVVGPQGPQGADGPQGPQGIQGSAGPAGNDATINGLNVLTLDAEAPITTKQEGNALTIGLDSSAIPSAANAVTVPGGATLEMGASLGEGPYTFEFEEDGDGSAVSAAQVSYDGTASGLAAETVQGALDALDAQKADASRTNNPNLLDNWYFLDPINQNGETEYPAGGTAVSYIVDRWRKSKDAKVSLSESGLAVSGGWIQQILDLDKKELLGRPCTLSLLSSDNKLYSAVHTLKSTDATEALDSNTDFGKFRLQSFLIGGIVRPAYAILLNQNIHLTIVAVKLELGPVQTLAHKEGDTWVLNDPPPNKAAELAKCQRYYYVSNTIKDPICYFGSGYATSDKSALISIGVPNFRTYSAFSCQGKFKLEFPNGVYIPVKSITLNRNSTTGESLLAVASENALTVGQPCVLSALNDANARIIFDANL